MIGRTFAILTMSDEERGFRGNRRNFIDLIRVGRERGFVVYVVTVRNLMLRSRFIEAWIYDFVAREWRAQRMPFPRFIYNRIPNRDDEAKETVQRKFAAMRKVQRRVYWFNPTFFDKWQLFQWLRSDRRTSAYVPATLQLDVNSSQLLASAVTAHPQLYLKPIRGKAGQGIMRIERDALGPLKLRIQAARRSSVTKFDSVDTLHERLVRIVGNEEYVLQQGIRLARYAGRPFDLRLLVQKNGEGRWDVSGIGARLAGARSITTHVPRGGSIENPLRMLAQSFGSAQAARLLAYVREVALELAAVIERHAGLPHAEMSMDIGVDEQGGVWFFEANAKPMKFDEPDIRRRSLQRLFDYSEWLLQRGGRKR